MKKITDQMVAQVEEILGFGRVGDLEKAGGGMFKQVYWLPGKTHVLKVVNSVDETGRYQASFEYEWAMYVVADRRGWLKYFPETVWVESREYGMCMIQEACITSYSELAPADGRDGFPQEVYDMLTNVIGIYDLHGDNIGYTADTLTPVVLDWGYDSPMGDTPADVVCEACKDGKLLPETAE